jgi:O-antigen/teichoic acid export membrane protein
LRGYALPLSLSALSLSLYSRLDLFALKALGGTTVDAGIYGAAQNLSLLPNVFALSFSPLLLSTLSRLYAQGELDHAGEVGRQALRVVVGLLPFAALIAASASDLITALFGRPFAAGASLLAILIFGSVSVVMISIATAILTAAGQPYRTLALAAPLVPIAAIGHLTVIPSMGPLGAAAVTSLVAGAGAAAAVLVVYRSWQIAPAAWTMYRSLAVSAGVFALAAAWPTPGWDVLLKLGVLGFGIPLAFWALGEFDADELAFARSFISRTARVRPYIQGA